MSRPLSSETMPSRRYPQLVTHNPSGRLLAQPLWFAPKLHRAGEVMDVYGARQASNMHRLQPPSSNTPIRPGYSTGVQFRRRGNRPVRFGRGKTRPMQNSTRDIIESNSLPPRRSRERIEHAQGRRTEQLPSNVSTPLRAIPGNVCGSVNKKRTGKTPKNDSAKITPHLCPHTSTTSPQRQTVQADTEGSVDPLPLSVSTPLQGVVGGGFPAEVNPVSSIVPVREEASTGLVSEWIPQTMAWDTPEGPVGSLSLGVATPFPSVDLGSDPEIIPATPTQAMNSSSMIMDQASSPMTSLPASQDQGVFQPSIVEELVERFPSRAPIPLRYSDSRTESDFSPGILAPVMNYGSELLIQPSNPERTPPSFPGNDFSIGAVRLATPVDISSPGIFTPLLDSMFREVSERDNTEDLIKQTGNGSTRLMQGLRVQGPRVSQAQREYGQRGDVHPCAAQESGSRHAGEASVGDMYHQSMNGIQLQPSNPLSVSTDFKHGEKEDLATELSPNCTVRPTTLSERVCQIDDLPVIPRMEELIRDDGMAFLGFGSIEEGEVRSDILDELEEMLHSNEAIPFDEESLNILNSFSSNDVVLEDTDDDVMRWVHDGEELTDSLVEEQINNIIGLDRGIIAQADSIIETEDDCAVTSIDHVSEDTKIMDGGSDTGILRSGVMDADACDIYTEPIPMDGRRVAKCVKQFTSNDYGRLQKTIRRYGAYNKEELMKTFPGRSYEDVSERARYYFPSATRSTEWGSEEHQRLFQVIGNVVDWVSVAGHMNRRSVEEVKKYYFELLQR